MISVSAADAARPRLALSREQILAHRLRANALGRRLPGGPGAFRQATWAGQQDSVPRSGLLSIHARVAGVGPSAWEEPALVQLWGPRYSAYVVPARDSAVFGLGRLPDNAARRRHAEELADLLQAFLDGRRMSYGEAGRALGVHPNQLRYAATTGRVLIRWEGARQPIVWTVPAPEIGPADARAELARRYLHVFGPTTPAAFGVWAGIDAPAARAAFEAMAGALVPVRTPVGDGWILEADESSVRQPSEPPSGVRLLPSGDAYFLLWGADRELLVPEPERRAALWTPRVWPGAVLLNGEIVGTWRRADWAAVIEPWRELSAGEREAILAEAASMPLPDLRRPIQITWIG